LQHLQTIIAAAVTPNFPPSCKHPRIIIYFCCATITIVSRRRRSLAASRLWCCKGLSISGKAIIMAKKAKGRKRTKSSRSPDSDAAAADMKSLPEDVLLTIFSYVEGCAKFADQ